MAPIKSHTKETRPKSVACRICSETNAGGRRHYTVPPGSPQLFKTLTLFHFPHIHWQAAHRYKMGGEQGPAPEHTCAECSAKWPCQTIKKTAEFFLSDDDDTAREPVTVENTEFRWANKGIL